MHWFDQVFALIAVGCLIGLPMGVIAGWIWWRRIGKQLEGWRSVVSKVGVVYSALIVALITVCEIEMPHGSPPGAGFPFTYRWGPVIFRFSAVGILFVLAGIGWVRWAILVS